MTGTQDSWLGQGDGLKHLSWENEWPWTMGLVKFWPPSPPARTAKM